MPAEGGGGWRKQPFSPVLLSISTELYIARSTPKWCCFKCLNVKHFHVYILAWPVNTLQRTSMGVGVGVGWRSQGTQSKPWSSRFGKDVFRIAGTIKWMLILPWVLYRQNLRNSGASFPRWDCNLPPPWQGRKFAESLSTASFKSFGVFGGF